MGGILDLLGDRLPKKGILGDILDTLKLKKDTKPGKEGGDGLFGGPIGQAIMFLTGLAALWLGLTSDSSFTGMLKILGKWLILGPIKLAGVIISSTVKFFGKIARFILPKALVGFFDDALKGISRLMGNAIKAIKPRFLRPGWFAKVLGKAAGRVAMKILGKGGLLALRGIPVLGSVIDFAFAYMRFKKGDYIGGLIDLAAGIVGLIPGVGWALSLGLNVLNMILDLKGGGPSGRAKAQAGIDWGNLGWTILKGALMYSPIGPIIAFGKGIYTLATGGSARDALMDMAEWIPFMTPLLEALGMSRTGTTGFAASMGSMVSTIFTTIKDVLYYVFVAPILWIKDTLYPAIKDAVSGIIDGLVNVFVDLKNAVVDWLKDLPLVGRVLGNSPGPIKDMVNATGESFQKSSTKVQTWLDKNVKESNWLVDLTKDMFSPFAGLWNDAALSGVKSIADDTIIGLINLLERHPLPVDIIKGKLDVGTIKLDQEFAQLLTVQQQTYRLLEKQLAAIVLGIGDPAASGPAVLTIPQTPQPVSSSTKGAHQIHRDEQREGPGYVSKGF